MLLAQHNAKPLVLRNVKMRSIFTYVKPEPKHSFGKAMPNPKYNLNPPLGAIPRTKVRGFYAPRLEGRVQGMENARFIPRPKGRSFRAFFIIKSFLSFIIFNNAWQKKSFFR